jgi:hypothetical protein
VCPCSKQLVLPHLTKCARHCSQYHIARLWRPLLVLCRQRLDASRQLQRQRLLRVGLSPGFLRRLAVCIPSGSLLRTTRCSFPPSEEWRSRSDRRGGSPNLQCVDGGRICGMLPWIYKEPRHAAAMFARHAGTSCLPVKPVLPPFFVMPEGGRGAVYPASSR